MAELTDPGPPLRSIRRGRLWPAMAALLAVAGMALAAGPRLGRYEADLASTLLLFVALAQAWNILAGFAGQMSLGVGAFVGTGGYATGLLMLHTGAGLAPAIAFGALAGGLLAAVLAVPLLRMRSGYFAVGTLAASLALQAWTINWNFTGGSNGISLPIDRLPDGAGVYRLAVMVAGVTMAAALLVQRSRFGLRLAAVREDEPAAVGLGVSAFRHRLAALVLSGTLSGLVGSVVALQKISFEPVGMLGIGWTLNALLMTVVGGIGTLVGPLVGAVVVHYFLTRRLESDPTVGLIVEGVLLVVVVRFAPRGLWPLSARGLRALVTLTTRGVYRCPSLWVRSRPVARDSPASSGITES